MSNTSLPAPTAIEQQLLAATKELAKLPLLGPVMWLYARDPQRRFTFVADMDWRLLPPLVLEQCKLYSKYELPWAYFSWATVSAEVDQRLRSASPNIAPHEWRSGSIAWLIDVVIPFGEELPLIEEVIAQFAKGQKVSAWTTTPNGQPVLREFQG
jgi:cytolysin-activating lysine-acyltransferase